MYLRLPIYLGQIAVLSFTVSIVYSIVLCLSPYSRQCCEFSTTPRSVVTSNIRAYRVVTASLFLYCTYLLNTWPLRSISEEPLYFLLLCFTKPGSCLANDQKGAGENNGLLSYLLVFLYKSFPGEKLSQKQCHLITMGADGGRCKLYISPTPRIWKKSNLKKRKIRL
jgi:hypothetical protein